LIRALGSEVYEKLCIAAENLPEGSYRQF